MASRPCTLTIAVLAAASALLSCVSEPSYDGLKCSTERPCPFGYACGTDDRCHEMCTDDTGCLDPNERCLGGMCSSKDCLAPDGCSSTLDPQMPEEEVPEEVVPECETPADCTAPGPCQIADDALCRSGECVYRSRPCVEPPDAECLDGDSLYRTYSQFGVCNPDTDQCEYTAMDLDCPACQTTCLEPCIDVTCQETNGGCREAGYCVPGDPGQPPRCSYVDSAEGASCTLGDDLTPGVCRSGNCVQCLDDADCNDDNVCTADQCDVATNTCVFAELAGDCDDGDACTTVDTCQAGGCVGSSPIDCVDPPSECYEATGTCNPADGSCSYAPHAAGVTCTDDGQACTDDVCDGSGACAHPPLPNGQTCDDGDLCTAGSSCQEGACVGSNPVSCNAPPGPCYEEIGTCDPRYGTCTYAPRQNGSACNDGDACTQSDSCQDGTCVGTNPVQCNASPGQCYDAQGACDPSTGSCSYTPLTGTACSDGSACTQSDVCQNGACVGSNPITCNNPPGQCYEATGVCSDASGACSYSPRSSASTCDDGNACTYNDRCNGSGGCAGTAYSCGDGNACTSDSCNGSGGCSNVRISPVNLTPCCDQTITVSPGYTAVTMQWNACSDAQHYDVAIEIYQSGAWEFYFTYDENNPSAATTNQKMYYPNACNRWYRFRVRSFNGASHGPWSGWAQWYASC